MHDKTPTPTTPTSVLLPLPEAPVEIIDDPISERIRCDHPPVEAGGGELGEALLEVAASRQRPRVVALVPTALESEMTEAGFEVEGRMPGFYRGEEACAVLGASLSEARAGLAHPKEVAFVDGLVADKGGPRPLKAEVDTERAEVADAAAIAGLLGETFADYPTPSHEPAYVAGQIEAGAPFRVVREGERLVACASADLVEQARTAELTDCATRPTHRGQGMMQSLLVDLMGDLQGMGYPTAFTLARARIPGINLAFSRLGFAFRGRMAQSCRIGEGIEDMNIWSRALEVEAG